MKQLAIIIFISMLSGCAYFHDRGSDLADIITLSGETKSIGATVQAGPFLAGLSYGDGAGYGLRSGCAGPYKYKEYTILLGGRKQLMSNIDSRDRDYDLTSSLLVYPLEALYWTITGLLYTDFGADSAGSPARYVKLKKGGWQTCFQLEASASVFGGIRAGINPAEALDFIFGLTTMDICNDDNPVEKKEANKPPVNQNDKPDKKG